MSPANAGGRRAARTDSPRSVLVYGSCVSRDTIPYLSTSRVTLGAYIARQSLLSAYAPSGGFDIDVNALDSAFQRRMLEGDIESAAPETLRARAASTDLLVWDPVDERGGVWETVTGTRVTRSSELAATGYSADAADSGVRAVDFGTSRYWRRLDVSLARFREQLERDGLLERSLFLSAPLASAPDVEPANDEQRAIVARVAGQHAALEPGFAELRRRVKAAGFPVLEVPERVCAFDFAHRWGPAAYHYSTGFARFVASGIERRLGVGASFDDGPGTASLAEPCVVERQGFVRAVVDRVATSAHVRLEIDAESPDPARAALLALEFDGPDDFEVRGANRTDYRGYGHYAYVPAGVGPGAGVYEFSWDEPRRLRAVRLIAWQETASIRVSALRVEARGGASSAAR